MKGERQGGRAREGEPGREGGQEFNNRALNYCFAHRLTSGAHEKVLCNSYAFRHTAMYGHRDVRDTAMHA